MFIRLSGSSSAVERQLPKLDVAGSIPVSRSIAFVVFINDKRLLRRAKSLFTTLYFPARGILC